MGAWIWFGVGFAVATVAVWRNANAEKAARAPSQFSGAPLPQSPPSSATPQNASTAGTSAAGTSSLDQPLQLPDPATSKAMEDPTTCQDYLRKAYGDNWREQLAAKINAYPWRTAKGKENALALLDALCARGRLNAEKLALLNSLERIDYSAHYDEVYREALKLKEDLRQAVLIIENPGFWNKDPAVGMSMAQDVVVRAKNAGFGPCLFSMEWQNSGDLTQLYRQVLGEVWPEVANCTEHFAYEVDQVAKARWG